MISRVYTLRKIVQNEDGTAIEGEPTFYKGFDNNIKTATVLGIILIEDTLEVYAVDDNDYSRKQFIKYVADEREGPYINLLGFFRKE